MEPRSQVGVGQSQLPFTSFQRLCKSRVTASTRDINVAHEVLYVILYISILGLEAKCLGR